MGFSNLHVIILFISSKISFFPNLYKIIRLNYEIKVVLRTEFDV